MTENMITAHTAKTAFHARGEDLHQLVRESREKLTPYCNRCAQRNPNSLGNVDEYAKNLTYLGKKTYRDKEGRVSDIVYDFQCSKCSGGISFSCGPTEIQDFEKINAKLLKK